MRCRQQLESSVTAHTRQTGKLTSHVSYEEASIRLSTNLIRDRGKQSSVAFLELWLVWVRRVKVVGGVLM